jgi:HK97 gp10 family phage protein
MSRDAIGVTLDFKDVQKALENLPKEFQKSAEKAVLRAGSKPILKAARGRVAKNTGNLKKSLGVTITSNKSGWVGAKVGPRSGYKYKTKTGRKKRAGQLADAQEIAWYLETGTPKMSARPFIRPAIDAAQSEVIDAMAAGLEKHLTRVAARLAKKR